MIYKGGKVIAISGVPGAGKSRISAFILASLPSARIVQWDAYETMTKNPPEVVMDWMAHQSPYEEIKVPGLVEQLTPKSEQEVVIFEKPLGRAHPETGPLIDVSVWLECPADIALARKMQQMTLNALDQMKKLPDQEAQNYLEWLNSYLSAYQDFTSKACEIQRKRVRPLADLMLDTTQAIDLLHESIQKMLREKFA